MGVIRPIEILLDVSFALVETPVITALNPGGTVTPGIQTVTPGSMAGIYAGVLLVAGYSSASEEVVLVLSVTTATFSASFTKAHASTDQLVGAVFASGAPDHPLFTQAEMMGYLADAQNDFLLKVRPVYKAATSALSTNIPSYANPADAIRIERIAVSGQELFNVAQTDLDWGDRQQGGNPQYWYQDGINLSYGIAPVMQRNDTAELFYSQSATSTLGFLDALLVPDPMTFALKYAVLAKAFSKDGEQRDPSRAAFCQQFYEMFCFVSQKFLEGVQGRVRSAEETVEPALAGMRK